MARVVQADLQEHLGPDPLYPDLDKAHELREHGGMGPEVPDDQVDLVDPEFRDVEQNVDVLAGASSGTPLLVGGGSSDKMRASPLSMGLRMRRLPGKVHDAFLKSPAQLPKTLREQSSKNCPSTPSGKYSKTK